MSNSTATTASMQTDEEWGAESGQAPHIHACPHVSKAMTPVVPPRLVHHTSKCSQCDNLEQNWLCMQCHTVFCGRFAKKHMTTGHCVAMGFGDLSFWCYQCDNYLSHLHIPRVYKIYSAYHVAKFGNAPPQKPLYSDDEEKADANQPLPNVAAAASASTTSSKDEKGEEDGGKVVDGDVLKARATAEVLASRKFEFGALSLATAGVNDDAVAAFEGLTAEQLRDPLIDRVLGVIYGNALGDAVGLATEFMDKAETEHMYGKAENIPFPNYKRNSHNSRWTAGDWTDDTDQAILIMDSITETKSVDEVLFARKLRTWIREGFPELGDFGGMGLGMTVGSVCRHKSFLTEPAKASKEVWKAFDCKARANGAVMRTSVTGLYQYDNLQKVINNTIRYARTTHWDPLCVASCVAVTSVISLILQGAKIDSSAAIDTLLAHCEALAEAQLPQAVEVGAKEAEAQRAEFRKHFRAASLEELALDEPKAIGYTLKCMGAGLFGLRSNLSVKRILQAVALEAGDADTNGAVCGALIGARVGYRGLPADWIQAMPNKKWLDAKVIKFLRVSGFLPAEQAAAPAGGAAAAASAGNGAAKMQM